MGPKREDRCAAAAILKTRRYGTSEKGVGLSLAWKASGSLV